MKTLLLLLFPFLLNAQVTTPSNLRLISDSTFGTIEKNSKYVHILYNPGLQVGDVVLLPSTKDRGNYDVGNGWPNKRFSTIAEMNATDGLSGAYVGCLEDGNVYRRNLGVWQPYTHWGYYTRKIIPAGLRANIVAISGLTLTLNIAASESTVGVVVYYDNSFFLNKEFNWRDDFRINQGVNHSFTFPKGRYAIGQPIEIQQTFLDTMGMHDINGNGATIFSPPGFASASIHVGTYRTTIHDLNLEGNFKLNGFGFKKESYPTTGAYFDNPFEQLPGIMLIGGSNVGYNLKVKNTPVYALQVWRNSRFQDCEVLLEEGVKGQDAWQIHALAATLGSGFKNIKFYSPYISGGMEAARSTDVVFENITIVNGLIAFNSTGGCKFINSIQTFTKNAKELSEGMNLGHPFVDGNNYMAIYDGAADHSNKGLLIENVHFIQECFIDNAGNTIRAISMGDGMKNVTIKNCSYTRPNFTNQHSNQHAVFFSESLNNTIDGFVIKGIHSLDPYYGTGSTFRSDITMGGVTGTGLIKNVTGATSIIAAQGVTIENSPIGGISNQGCNVLAWNPRQRDTLVRQRVSELLFPNPGTEYVNIKTKENGIVNVYNSIGQKMLVSHTFNGQLITVKISQLPPGLYSLYVIRNRNYSISTKFVKQNKY